MAPRCRHDTTGACRVKGGSHMSATKRHSERSNGLAAMVMVIALLTALLAVAACGGGAADEWAFQKIDSSGGVYTIDDLLAAGLAKAESAWKGFWGADAASRTDYELRFYLTHEAAVQAGAPLADEATGEELRLKKDSQTWTEGAKDRWRSTSATGQTTGGVHTGPGPMYGDFAIFGNVIMLCEGAIPEQALERCEGLVLALREASTD